MEIIFKMIEMEQQLRILHWQTKSYARHNAFGNTYSALGDLIDSFAEAYMGKYGRFKVTPMNLKDINNDVDLVIEEYVEFLVSLTDQMEAGDSDLVNLRDEMLALMNKLKYLLTLK
jgi:DNA-binding ferritin-like protein